jgi:hypothetical protein
MYTSEEKIAFDAYEIAIPPFEIVEFELADLIIAEASIRIMNHARTPLTAFKFISEVCPEFTVTTQGITPYPDALAPI